MKVESIIYAIDLVGVASFAISGALRALHRRPDFVAMTMLATAAAVGGGLIRDILLQRPVVFLRDWGYPIAILLSVLATFVFTDFLRRSENLLRYFDAIGLGLFSATTASAAWNTEGVTPLGVLFIATITGRAGGIIRDLLIHEPPSILTTELYITPGIVGSAGLVAVMSMGGSDLAGIAVAMTVTTSIRVLAIVYDWQLPRIAYGAHAKEESRVSHEERST